MEKKKSNLLKNAFFLAFGMGMMWYVFKDIVWLDFWADVKSMDYRWFAFSAVFMVTAHFFRALRWKQLIVSNGHNPSTKNVFASVLFMYVSNLVIPRSGEIARCGTIYKYENIPVPLLIGTVVIERLTDLISLLVLTVLIVFIRFDVVNIMYNETALPEIVDSIIDNQMLLILIVAIGVSGLVAIFILRKKIAEISLIKKIQPFLDQLKNSFIKLIQLKSKFLYLVYTISIWICYLGMFYIGVFAFAPTEFLSLSDGIVAFIAGSYGMVAPTPGGVGVWPAIVSEALIVLDPINITVNQAKSWAGVSFILMTVTTAAAGVIGFIALPFINKDKSSEQ
tara:strand:- start:785 stop:1795 length:1011 start_codon:yes stop_codon:yes gene_type:complete